MHDTFPQTSVTIYQSAPRHIPEGQGSHLNPSGRFKNRAYCYPVNGHRRSDFERMEGHLELIEKYVKEYIAVYIKVGPGVA